MQIIVVNELTARTTNKLQAQHLILIPLSAHISIRWSVESVKGQWFSLGQADAYLASSSSYSCSLDQFVPEAQQDGNDSPVISLHSVGTQK